MVLEEGMREGKRRDRIRGGKAFLRENFDAIVADGTNELRAAGFDGTENAWHAVHLRSITHPRDSLATLM